MTTSNPNVPQPAGAADPDGEDDDNTVDPLLRKTVEGAVPDEQVGKQDDGTEPSDVETDSVEDDKRRSGAG